MAAYISKKKATLSVGSNADSIKKEKEANQSVMFIDQEIDYSVIGVLMSNNISSQDVLLYELLIFFICKIIYFYFLGDKNNSKICSSRYEFDS